ncbi:MAG: protein rep, partial [Christensenellaceae bacterium]
MAKIKTKDMALPASGHSLCAAGAKRECPEAGTPLVNYEVCLAGSRLAEKSKNKRVSRWKRRNIAQNWVAREIKCENLRDGLEKKLPRTFWCGHALKGFNTIDVRCSDQENHANANFSGIQYCGSVWECPVCSALIRNKRAHDVSQGVENWLSESHGVFMLTLTTRHYQCDSLRDSLECITKAWRSITSLKAWKDLRIDMELEGYIRSLEVTHGTNGWHPHFHFLLFSKKIAAINDAQMIENIVLEAWKKAVPKNGGRLPNEHGVKVRCVGGENQGDIAAEYISKVFDGKHVSLEMARSDLKTTLGDEAESITPFELLDFPDNMHCARLWQEYRTAIKGKRSIFFTKGLRKLLGLTLDKTDEEIIEELQSVGELVVQVPADVYEKKIKTNAEIAVQMLELIEKKKYEEAACLVGCNVEIRELLDKKTGCLVECRVMKKLAIK